MEPDWYARADEAAAALRRRLGIDGVDSAVVLGSGWSGAAEAFGSPRAVLTMAGLPHFIAPTAVGHRGSVALHQVGGRTVLVFAGRTHLYEGHGPGQVVHAVRTAAALGACRAILTNANGSLRPAWGPGTGVLIRDHLNLAAVSPLVGARFVDLTDAYSPRLREIARAADASLVEGVYALLSGPHYETVAEARMIAALGADVIGMSTVLETIAAREAGMDVLGLSVVTTVEATGEPIDADEVVAQAERAAAALGPVVAAVIAAA